MRVMGLSHLIFLTFSLKKGEYLLKITRYEASCYAVFFQLIIGPLFFNLVIFLTSMFPHTLHLYSSIRVGQPAFKSFATKESKIIE